jgi:hypothetical protein
VGHRRRRVLSGVPLDGAGARRTAERPSGTVARDEVKDLRRVVRIWTRLTHRPSDDPSSCATFKRSRMNSFHVARLSPGTSSAPVAKGICLLVILTTACGPKAHIPLVPSRLPGQLAATDSGALLARSLAPVLYLQRDETFPLSRAVAVLHPSRRVIAYHLLWRDDVHGAWLPFTKPTDEEIVWVGYDATNAPTELWTYWHGVVLHTPVPKTQVAIDVQWGKHGSLPRGLRESDLPAPRKLNEFYALTIVGLPDILLGDLSRKGPLGFFHGYRRYRDFNRPILLADRLNAVVRLENPDPALRLVFGVPYSHKRAWPN